MLAMRKSHESGKSFLATEAHTENTDKLQNLSSGQEQGVVFLPCVSVAQTGFSVAAGAKKQPADCGLNRQGDDENYNAA
jgi:hypothetical protein